MRRRRSIISSKVVRRDTLPGITADSDSFSINNENCDQIALDQNVLICVVPGKKSNAKTAGLNVLTGLVFYAIH